MRKIFKLSFVLVVVFIFNNTFADSINITQINFTSSPQSIDANTTSAILTVQTQNSGGSSESLDTSGTILNLSSTSSTGQFSDANANSCTGIFSNTPFSLGMSKGSANKHFCYKDSTAGTFTLTISAQGQTWTPATQNIIINSITPAPTATFIIRNGSSVIYQGTVPLLADKSVLATLQSIDATSDAFSITNVQNYSFGKYLKCLLPSGGAELCDNWQFAVGSVNPFSSIDTTILSGGETVGIYFGNSHQLILNTNSIITGASITATAQKYDYQNNVWNPLTGISVGVTLPNPADPWNPTIVSTHPVDGSGNATFSISGANTYTLGIAEDYYFPSYTVTVAEAPASGGGASLSLVFNNQKALAYLKSTQSPDGSFGDSILYTDWAGIAFSALNITDSSRDKLLSYLNSHNTISTLLTDNERMAMTLLSLNQNPYSFNGTNYIDAIVKSFDGTQFGDVNLINDDVFALIPLKNSGYIASDDIITKDVAFIISKQKADGSWDESVDITSAAIQALKSFDTITGASDAIQKASNYLIDKEGNDGGWGNVSSTSWAMQAMSALSASWSKGGHTSADYLGAQQAPDGAALPASETLANRIWTTSYAITASSSKPWSAIMQMVQKPSAQNTSPNTVQKDSDVASIKNETISENKTDIKNTLTISKTPKQSISSILATSANASEITPSSQTASAGNVFLKNLPNQVAPYTLGVLSGILILYFVRKFFIL